MQIECIPAGILGTNCYFVINEDTKEIAIIDPGGYSKKMKTTIQENGYIPAAILLTHGHFDHMMGVAPLLEDYPVPVYIMAAEEDILLDPQKNLSAKYTEGCTLEGVTKVHDGDKISAAGFVFTALKTPGHTVDGCCYYLEDREILFSGDTLFHASVGRFDLPTSCEEDLIRSIREKLFVLPEAVKVLPGHASATTIGFEKDNNPYVK